MAAEEEKSSDFYAVLGLEKECSESELRIAYKKLAMKWHPDRCSASGNLDHVEEAKKKFQAIQQAYSVLSDANKRFLYDVGVYDSDDENDENGMGDFLNEMVSMMSQSKQNEKRNSSFDELQRLFEDIFHSEATDSSPLTQEASQDPSVETLSSSNKRNSPCHVNTNNCNDKATHFQGFSIGGITEGERRGRREGRKQKISSGEDVSSGEYSASHISC